MFEHSVRRRTRLAAYLLILSLILTAFATGCKKSDGEDQAAAGPGGRRGGRGGARAASQNAGQTADAGGGGQAAAGRGGRRGGAAGAGTAAQSASTPAAQGAGGRAGGRGGQPATASGDTGAGGVATELAEVATARLLAAAVAESGLVVDAKVQAEAVKEMAPLVQQMGIIGKNDQEVLFVRRVAASLKKNKDLLAQTAAGGLAASGLVLSTNTVAGTEVQKAARIQKFAAFYGPVVWVKEANWDGRIIEWVTLKHESMNVKLPLSLVMDAPRLSALNGYFPIYNDTGFRKVESKQTITAPAGLKEKVLAEEQEAAKLAAATAAASVEAADDGGGGGGGGRGGGGRGGRGGGGRGGRRGGGGMMGG